jgi:UDPglucose 6-dehydrogenase
VRGKTIGVLGLTFKPNTDDMREAPSIDIIGGLLDGGARVVAYDPQGMPAARQLIDRIEFGTSAYDVADDADALVLITEWNEFRSLDLARLKSAMRSAVLVDLRNVYRHDEVIRHGFAYTSVGRGTGKVPDGAAEAAE